MKLKFENQPFQLQAVNNTVALFSGMNSLDFSTQLPNNNEILTFDVVANSLQLDSELLIKNLQSVQLSNKIENYSHELYYGDYLGIANFSLEMETGTGKTYVYLRSIFELNKQYGLTKFIIVVPSDAIRLGTLKTLEITQEHFKDEFNNVSYDYYQYDSSKINKVRDFATTNTIQIMVMTIAAFNKQSNNIYNVKDTFGEYLPIELIKAVNPVVIIDEPQSVDNTQNARDAIKELSPLFILRYSATHRELYNQIYKLDALDAFAQKLVKQIEVASIEDATFADFSSKPYIKVIEITPKLELSLELIVQDKKGNFNTKVVKKIPKGANLADKTNNQAYDNYVVEDFSRDYGLKLANLDYELAVGQAIGNEENIELKTSMMIRLVIENHIKRELRLLPEKIKVLSLFFINKVADYRIHNQDGFTDGKLVKMFIEQFKIVLKTNYGKEYIEKARELFGIDLTTDYGLNQLHDGYFAKDKKGGYKDCKSDTQDAEVAYDLIMRDKEKLLDIKMPLRFIFSHSALKEGWDNPNVFQVCVLQNATGEFKRRQQIGRGLRLCVNSDGIRVKDEKINMLTIIAGESYINFATQLQKEYETDAKIKFGNIPIKNQKNKVEITVNQQVFMSDEFKQLWGKINQKTIYQVDIDTQTLITNVVEAINDKLEIKAPSFKTSRVRLNIEHSGIGTELQHTNWISLNSYQLDVVKKIYLATGLTRKTIVRILCRISSDKLDLLNINSGAFVEQVTEIINNQKVNLLVSGIKYRKIEEYYAQSLIKQEVDYGYDDATNSNIADANILGVNSDDFASKFLYNVLRYDSKIEVEFLKTAISMDKVKLITKLPSWFKVNTPLGKYNPDWALLLHEDNKENVYFIVETKGDNFDSNARVLEKAKTDCGKKHFIDTLGVEYKICSNANKLLN